jgi:hypothetical protein
VFTFSLRLRSGATPASVIVDLNPILYTNIGGQNNTGYAMMRLTCSLLLVSLSASWQHKYHFRCSYFASVLSATPGSEVTPTSFYFASEVKVQFDFKTNPLTMVRSCLYIQGTKDPCANGPRFDVQVSIEQPLVTLTQLFSSVSGGIIGLLSVSAVIMGYVEMASHKL